MMSDADDTDTLQINIPDEELEELSCEMSPVTTSASTIDDKNENVSCSSVDSSLNNCESSETELLRQFFQQKFEQQRREQEKLRCLVATLQENLSYEKLRANQILNAVHDFILPAFGELPIAAHIVRSAVEQERWMLLQAIINGKRLHYESEISRLRNVLRNFGETMLVAASADSTKPYCERKRHNEKEAGEDTKRRK